MKYCCLGILRKEYFRLVTRVQIGETHWNIGIVGSKNKKHLRGSAQATIHPLAIILTAALWALVSIIIGEYCGPSTASEAFLIL